MALACAQSCRAQPRTRPDAASLATGPAAGADLVLDTGGSTSADAEVKTAAAVARVQTRAKTTAANRALRWISASLDDCMMCPENFVWAVGHCEIDR